MLYKWPQGRVIRTVFLVVALIIAGDLGYLGAWAGVDAYLRTQDVANLITGIVFGVLAVVALVGGVLAAGFLPKTAQFLIEVETEMAKVTWPKSNEVTRSTIIISIMTVLLALFIYVIDAINYAWVHNWLLEIGG